MGQRIFKPLHKSAPGKNFKNTTRAKKQKMYRSLGWEGYREKFLKANPWCYACGDKATAVDHLIPHKGDEYLFKKLDNHIPLCKQCHNAVTMLFDYKYVKGQPVDEKIKWLNRNRVPGESKRVTVLGSYNKK